MLITYYYAETPHWILVDSLAMSREEVQEFLNKNNYENAEIKSYDIELGRLLLQLMRDEHDQAIFFKAAGLKVMKLKS